jgi:hypothetical protein
MPSSPKNGPPDAHPDRSAEPVKRICSEDWPDKHKTSVKKIHSRVQQAQQNGKRVLIVPARINGQGDADQYLKGVDFGWAQGFAQTEFFAQWFEQTVQQAAF